MIKKIALFSVLLMMFFLVGCKSEQKSSTSPTKKQVVASIYPVYEFARAIAGEKMDVSLFVTDKNIHDKELGVADLKKIQSADVFLYNGGGVEPWVDKLVAGSDNKKMLFVNTGEGLFTADKRTDPHIWLDISLAIKQVDSVCQTFVKIDPENAFFYKQNAENYVEKLNSLHNQFVTLGREKVGREFVVMHPAFGYMAKRYGFEQIALVGLDEHSEPTPKDVARLCNVIADKKIKFVFVASDVDDKIMKQIAQTTKTKVLFLDSLESSTGSSYIEVMQTNLQNLQKAFEI